MQFAELMPRRTNRRIDMVRRSLEADELHPLDDQTIKCLLRHVNQSNHLGVDARRFSRRLRYQRLGLN